jgi:DNA-binding MarR family transcriptional regulator
MNKRNLTENNNDLWILFGDVYHQLVLVRQRELTEYHIPIRQLHALRTLQQLGSKATISELAIIMGRKPNVISRQVVRMENDGLIKRIKSRPKSNQLRLELTEKGLNILKISTKSKENTIDSIFAFLTVEDRQKIESIFNTVLTRLKEYIPEQL